MEKITGLPTYQQQFDKITEAYIKGEIKPMACKFCFCGTLSPDNFWGAQSQHPEIKYPYSVSEYTRMEDALFLSFPEVGTEEDGTRIVYGQGLEYTSKYEDKLFDGMCAALEVLRQIHIERGEVIEDAPVFTKRELATT